jgi:hypothetical protein
MHAALESAGAGEAFAIERNASVRAESLEVDPVVARGRNGERAFPGDD